MWEKIKSNIFKKNKLTDIDYIIVGLGNPGEKYAKTAHNVGFRVIDHLHKKETFSSLEKDKYLNALVAKGDIKKNKIVLLLPQTFMNLSGISVKKSLVRLNVDPQNLIVVHDDTDLPLGLVRFSVSRGSAGHKGVESIIRNIKSKNFIRIRVGVSNGKEEAKEVVLKNMPIFINKIEERVAEEVIQSLSDNIFSKTIKIDFREKERHL